MRRIRLISILVTILVSVLSIQMAQAQDLLEIAYGETQTKDFEANRLDHRWFMLNADRFPVLEAEEGDMLRIRVFRIGGQFTPTIRLLTGANEELAVSSESPFTDTAELIYDEGLPALNVGFQIEVSRPDDSSYDTLNPPQYSLTLELIGHRRDATGDILPNIAEPPSLESENSQSSQIGVTIFGENVESTQSSSGTVFSSLGWELTVNPQIAAGIVSAAFLDNGIGLQIRRDNNPVFFSDQNFTVEAFENENEYRFTIHNFDGSQTQIISDFRRVQWIQSRNGVISFAMLPEGEETEKYLIFNNDYVDIRRISSGETEAALYQIKLEPNGQFIQTDFLGWNQLAYYDNQLRVDYGRDARFLSDTAYYLIKQNSGNPELNDIAWFASESPTATRLDFQIDWQGLAEVEIAAGQVRVQNLLGENTPKSLDELYHTIDPTLNEKALIIKQGAMLFTGGSGENRTYLTVLPDGTRIETPSQLNTQSDILPYAEEFRTRNYNNLGDNILPLCTCIESIEPMIPVNPVNGNFFYKVDDFSFPGHLLQLALTRYYNSYDVGLTPDYMLDSPASYPRMGVGWRHSYQYELDMSTAPLGQIRFIEPDGTGHYFAPQESTPNTWRSRTLWSMVIIQDEGVLGSWRAETTDGLTYYFDPAGRLTRISSSSAQSITIVPALASSEQLDDSGIFIVEPYGRRIELIKGESGYIEFARDSFERLIRYSYTDNQLTSVAYDISATRTASYSYHEQLGFLERYEDVRSHYVAVGTLTYDEQGRVVNYVENPDGTIVPDYTYSYDTNEAGDFVTTRSILVNDPFSNEEEPRKTTWVYDERFLLTNLVLMHQDDNSSEDWVYEFHYDDNSGRLDRIRIPTLVNFTFVFDQRGNLREFQDPLRPVPYSFEYVQAGNRSLLMQIDYPSNRVDYFEWSNDDNPKLIEHRIRVAESALGDIFRSTHFVYDEAERLALIVKLDDLTTESNAPHVGTLYQYDNFGYVSSISQGIALQNIDFEAPDVLSNVLNNNTPLQQVNFSHDQFGQLRSFQNGNNTFVLNWLDGKLSEVRDSEDNDFAIRYDYDERGRLNFVNDRGHIASYTYNGLDLVAEMTMTAEDVRSDNTDTLEFDYDEAGNLLEIRDDLNRRTRFRYDSLDNLMERITPSEASYTYEIEIDPRGLLLRRESDPIDREIERQYDAIGRLEEYRITAEGFQQIFQVDYNSANNPTNIIGVIAETGRVFSNMTIGYNFVGDIRSIAVNGALTTFAYDDYGHLISRTSPDRRTTQYQYDALGNVLSVTLPEAGIWQYAYGVNSNLESVTDPNGLTTQYVYDKYNQLSTILDPLGNTQQIYSYDIHGNLTGITDARNNFRSFEYDNRNNLTTVTDENEQRIRYGYDTVGRLTDLSQPVISFTYDDDDNIIGLTQIEATRTLFSYDAIGRITSISDPLGHTTTYQYNPVGRITQVIDSIGNEQIFAWEEGAMYLAEYTNVANQTFTINKDSLGRVTSIQPESDDGLNTYFSYDLDGYVTGVTVASDIFFNDANESNDLTYRYSYNNDGLPISYRNAIGGLWGLNYDAGSRLNEVLQPNGSVIRYQYDELSRITDIEYYADADPNTEAYAVESFEYNPNGSIRTYTSPNGNRNAYIYDKSNRITQATLAAESEVERIYLFDDRGRGIFRIIDPLGRETNYYYQLNRFRRVEKTVPGIDAFDYSYFDFDGAGNLTNIQLLASPFTQNGETIEINQTYDALNRRVRFVNTDNKSWSYTYDALGNLTQVSDPLGSVVAYTYSSDNRVTSIQYPSGNTVTLEYDGVGNLESIILPPNVASNSQEIFYELDPLGNITQIGNAAQILNNNGLRYDYDAMGNVIQRTMPDGAQTSYEYDGSGRLITTRYADAAVIDYQHDADGNLTYAGNDVFNSSYTYDSLGQVQTADENGLQFSYGYDAVGNLANLNAEDLGIARVYIYDALDRLKTVQLNDNTLVEFEYNDLDQITDIKRYNASEPDNAINTVIRYDSAGRPITITHTADSRFVDGFGYTYDAVGNLIRIERGDGSVILYSYDVDHRLISERWLNAFDETIHVVSFRYDATGNRTEEIRNGRRTVYTYNDQNRLIREDRNLTSQRSTAFILPSLGLGAVAIFMVQRRRRWLLLPALFVVVSVVFAQTSTPQTTVSYAYDFNGNLNRITYQSSETYELTLAYDAENRLIAVTGQNENGEDANTQLTYDQFSRLVEWHDNETVYTLYYDGDTLFGMSDGNTFQEFLYGDEQLLLTQIGDESFWHLNDQIGSTRRYINQQGQDVSEQFDFGSFGLRIFPYEEDDVAPEGSELHAPTVLFGGQLYDPSTGLYLTGLRAYDPKTGRFLQPDPIRQDPIGTLYTYARNRPMVFNDPSGLTAQPFVEPLDAAILKDELKPESVIPRPNLPDSPAPSSVHRLQADETFRAFHLLEEIRYGTNTVVGELSPLRDDFYLFDFNPMPDVVRQFSTEPLSHIMNIYETGDSWMPDPSPNPTIVLNPFAQIDTMQPIMAQAYLQPLYWSYGDPVLSDILPSVSVPQGLSGRNELETELTTVLQPISLMTALIPETEYLLDIDNFVSVPQLPQIDVELPSSPVEPPVLHDLDALRQQTFDFYSRILPPDFTCESCLRPLSFNP